jgi:hypothetical protein
MPPITDKDELAALLGPPPRLYDKGPQMEIINPDEEYEPKEPTG